MSDQQPQPKRRPDVAALAIGLGLMAIAGVMLWDSARLADDLGPLLHGHGGLVTRLSDAGLVKLFRLLRLARRLLDLEAGVASQDS